MGLSIAVFTEIEETKDDNDYDFTAYVIAERWENRIKHLKKDTYYKGRPEDNHLHYLGEFEVNAPDSDEVKKALADKLDAEIFAKEVELKELMRGAYESNK